MSKSIFDIALGHTKLTKAELAQNLGTSVAWLSKWANDGNFPFEVEGALDKMLGLEGLCLDLVEAAGSIEDARKWQHLFASLAEEACNSIETGFDMPTLLDDDNDLGSSVIRLLNDMGVEIPQEFPNELLEPEGDLVSDDEIEAWTLHLDEHPIVLLIRKIFAANINLLSFYFAFVQPLIDRKEHATRWAELGISQYVFEESLLDLAACNIGVPIEIAKNMGVFYHQTTVQFLGWLRTIKREAYAMGFAFEAEIMDLITNDVETLGQSAMGHVKTLGVLTGHPDMYIDDMSYKINAIHRVMPLILQKLGITEEDLESLHADGGEEPSEKGGA